MGLFGLFGRKKEVELNKVKDDNKEKFLREPGDNNTEGILQFENLIENYVITIDDDDDGNHDDDDDGDWWWWGHNLTDGQGNTSSSIVKDAGGITSSYASRLIGNENGGDDWGWD